MDLSNISTEELNNEIERRKVKNILISHIWKLKELEGHNNYDLFITKRDYIRMAMDDRKEVEEDDIVVYDIGAEHISDSAELKKVYFYSSFTALILDNVYMDEILRNITDENKVLDFSDIKSWTDIEYFTVRLKNGKEVYLYYIGGDI